MFLKSEKYVKYVFSRTLALRYYVGLLSCQEVLGTIYTRKINNFT